MEVLFPCQVSWVNRVPWPQPLSIQLTPSSRATAALGGNCPQVLHSLCWFAPPHCRSSSPGADIPSLAGPEQRRPGTIASGPFLQSSSRPQSLL